MDALSSTDVVPGRRKRKISTLQAVKSNTSTAAVVPPSPEDKKPQPPSVCKFVVSFFLCCINAKKYTSASVMFSSIIVTFPCFRIVKRHQTYCLVWSLGQ